MLHIGGAIRSLSWPKISTECSGICIFDNKYTAKTVIIAMKHQFQQVDWPYCLSVPYTAMSDLWCCIYFASSSPIKEPGTNIGRDVAENKTAK